MVRSWSKGWFTKYVIAKNRIKAGIGHWIGKVKIRLRASAGNKAIGKVEIGWFR